MTAADQLRAEGRLEARREDLLELLEIKFGAVDCSVRVRVEQAPLEQLRAWMRRGIVATTLDEVFAG